MGWQYVLGGDGPTPFFQLRGGSGPQPFGQDTKEAKLMADGKEVDLDAVSIPPGRTEWEARYAIGPGSPAGRPLVIFRLLRKIQESDPNRAARAKVFSEVDESGNPQLWIFY